MIDIKDARKAAGLTQQQLADLIGVKQSRIGKIECGEIKIQNITLLTAYKLSKALNIDIVDLL